MHQKRKRKGPQPRPQLKPIFQQAASVTALAASIQDNYKSKMKEKQ